MKKYVCGLMFSEDKSLVALVVKNKPDWQKGLLNGIGGKIEESDTYDSILKRGIENSNSSLVAMCREFKEETGVVTANEDWDLFLTMGSDVGKANDENIQQYTESWSVDFYRSFSDKVHNVKTMEEEEIKLLSISGVLGSKTIDNLKWIILLALDKNPKFTKVEY